MNDRELLELAAKAVGFGATDQRTGALRNCWTESEYPRGSGNHGALWNYVGYMDTAELWNPLSDDGDALRLAVKLHIDLHWSHLGYATAFQMPLRAAPTIRIDEYGADPCATTRRAIVRVAAEIGRAMS